MRSVSRPTAVSTATAPKQEKRSDSYSQILKSSSIVGGAQAINLVLRMVRIKLVALLLGPTGVGLIGLYESVIGLIETLSGLGVGSSGVRQVAEAHGSGNLERVGRTVGVLRRVCWFTGMLGVVLTVLLSKPLSIWTFGSSERATPIAILGLTLLLLAISNGQLAIVRGVRRIGDLARIQVLSSLASLMIGVGLYSWLGERGIVPVFLMSATVNLGFSWWFARRVPVPPAPLDWRTAGDEVFRLIRLGLAFMVTGLCTVGVGWAARAWVLRDFGLHGSGMYQAAWGISGVFAGFILSAMGMDFYPRLTAAAGDNAEVNRLVNEQTEIGILLALPGLLATMVFSPWVIRVFYSTGFGEAADLLPWFVMGVLGRVISWPLGFIQLAKGAVRWFAATEIIFNGLHLFLIWLGLRWFGLLGVAVAFTFLYGCYTIGMIWIGRRLTQFRWSEAVERLLGEASLVAVGAFLLARFAPPMVAGVVGVLVVLLCGLICLRRICLRLGKEHRMTLWVGRIPKVGSWLLG